MSAFTLKPAFKKVVIDAGVAIRLQRPESLGEECFITPQVLGEIKDTRARVHLSTFTVPLNSMSPTEKDINWVRSFATKTGDIGFLSENDIGIIALAYMLQRQTGNVKNLRTSPNALTIVQKNLKHTWAPPKAVEERDQENKNKTEEKGSAEKTENKSEVVSGLKHIEMTEEEMDRLEKELDDEYDEQQKREEEEKKLDEISRRKKQSEAAKAAHAAKVAAEAAAKAAAQSTEAPGTSVPAPQQVIVEISGEEVIEDVDPEGGEWITPQNLKHFNATVFKKEEETISDEIALVSTDYSVQNVAMQMGLTVTSIYGMKIRTVKLWAQICDACKEMERDTTKLFCQSCGYAKFRRVPIIVDQKTGAVRVHDNPNRIINLRGINYSIPKYVGGRRDDEVIFCQSQLHFNNRQYKWAQAKKKHAQEMADANPFNDGSAQCGEKNFWGAAKAQIGGKGNAHKTGPRPIVGFGRGNPNANSWQKKNSSK
eukprot:GDKJ01019020.1.p1 GENE.GDKJ01019020.1~~GDKJ01019020.1.p1  ORF type:complete len:483 (+),score=138.78 GDKJ01019020.1:15-1463(+)